MIKAVSFDLWFTLVWEDDSGLKEYQERRVDALYHAFKSYSKKVTREAIEAFYRSTGHIRMFVNNRDLVRFLTYMVGVDLDDSMIDYITEKYIESTFYWKPNLNEEARPTLRGIKEELDIAIVILSNTSFSEKAIWKLLENVGIDKYVDHIFSSADIGFVKPMPEAFQTIFDTLEISPEEVVHVGDTYLDDVVGAFYAGAKAVLYTGLWKHYDKYRAFKNRDRLAVREDIPIISNLTELIDLIKVRF